MFTLDDPTDVVVSEFQYICLRLFCEFVKNYWKCVKMRKKIISQ